MYIMIIRSTIIGKSYASQFDTCPGLLHVLHVFITYFLSVSWLFLSEKNIEIQLILEYDILIYILLLLFIQIYHTDVDCNKLLSKSKSLFEFLSYFLSLSLYLNFCMRTFIILEA